MSHAGPPANQAIAPGVRRYFPTNPAGARAALTPAALADAITSAAHQLGFARVGFAPVEHFTEASQHLTNWLAADKHGTLSYMAEAPDRADPSALLREARTVISVALPYPGGGQLVALRRNRTALLNGDTPLNSNAPLSGVVAAYALGQDYHEVIKQKLAELASLCATLVQRPVVARSCVDSAPLLEREAARRAGVGFIAKSTMNIVPGVGSFVLLGELLVDLDIAPSQAVDPGCGRCRACLDACPTQAFDDAYRLDARRCISYLTIEHHGVIPRELRRPIGTRIFGCDICQDVCPYNASLSPRQQHPAEFRPREPLLVVNLVEWLELGSAAYRRLVKHSALGRAPRRVLKRNAAIALGNGNDSAAIAPLSRAAQADASELVRGHAAWALGELFSHRAPEVRSVLQRVARTDSNEWVREEARLAIEQNVEKIPTS